MRCPRCGAEMPEENSFCTRCGRRLREKPPAEERRTGPGNGGIAAAAPPGRQTADPSKEAPSAAGWSDVAAARLVACPRCGATNAASRRRCGRCRSELDTDPSEPRAPVGDAGPMPQAEPEARESSGLLVLATVFAGLTILGVTLTILSARGIGPFAGPGGDETPQPGEPVPVEVVEVEASSELPAGGDGTYDATNLVDGDPTTAWNEAASGDGTGEWVELRLAEPAAVRRLLLWNGYQKEERFAQHPRVRSLSIQAGDRSFTVTLLDDEGPMSVDLPAPVRTDTVRLTIGSVYPGARYNDAALSEVEILAQPEP